MAKNRNREFQLNENEILQLLVADNSDGEDDLLLDEEDQQFIAQDIDAGIETVYIETPNLDVNTDSKSEIYQSQQNRVELNKVPIFKWKHNCYQQHNFKEKLDYNFGEITISDSELISSISPFEVFSAVTNFDYLIDKILCPESIKYAIQNGNVYAVSKSEMKAFLGMNYVMGYHVLPTIRSYWSTQPDMGVPFIANIMPLSRFEEIRRNLHFSDNQNQPDRTSPEYDRAYKIRPVMNHFNISFQKAMNNTKSQSIDEHMIKFKGHNIMKQYVKNKPVKWGFKLWCRADSQTGYLYEFDLYTGRKNSGPEIGLGESVVMQLTKCIQGLGCEIYIDSFFNSPNLQYNLAKQNIKACGTVRVNRKNVPKNLPLDKNMKRGEIFATSFQGISFVKWMDNKSVHLLTNFLSPVPTATVKRRKAGSDQRLMLFALK